MTLPWTEATETGLTLVVDLRVYPRDVVLRTCHAFAARGYFFARTLDEHSIRVDVAAREGDSLRALAGEFSNALIDNQLRAVIGEETRVIRELLVAQAFCEADLLDRREIEREP